MKVDHVENDIHVQDDNGNLLLIFHDWGPDGCGSEHHYSAHTADWRYRLHGTDGFGGPRWVDLDALGEDEEMCEDWEGRNPTLSIDPVDLLFWATKITNEYLPVRDELVVVPPMMGGAA